MRVLGLDIGERRIGIALSDSLGITAQRLTVVERQSQAQDIEAIALLVAKHNAQRVIVGLPLTLRGERGTQAKRVESFSKALLRRCEGVPLEYVDERLTTVQGERALLETDTSRRRRKEVIDLVAAQLILQSYLDKHRKDLA